jgi:hypothetical protein
MMDDNETSGGDAPFRVTLKGPGITVDREVDQATAVQVMTLVIGLPSQEGRTPSPLPPAEQPAPDAARVPIVPGGARLSLREYFDQAEPKRNPDKILTIAAYLEDHRGHQTFGKDAVKREFRNAGEATPGNYARDFRWTVTNGWIAEAPDVPDEYYVTTKGRQAISDKFSLEVKKASSSTKVQGRRRPRSRGEGADA